MQFLKRATVAHALGRVSWSCATATGQAPVCGDASARKTVLDCRCGEARFHRRRSRSRCDRTTESGWTRTRANRRHRHAVGEHQTLGHWCEARSEEHTSELQSLRHLVCRLLLEKKKTHTAHTTQTLPMHATPDTS